MDESVTRRPSGQSHTGGEGSGSRLRIHGIQAMPSAVDEELAVIFREMRRASHLDRNQLSDQLRTPVAVIEALETGAIGALPSWPETIRVVNAYTRMLGLDPRPILRRIRSQMDAAAATGPRPKEIDPASARQAARPEADQSAPAGAEAVSAPPVAVSSRPAPERPAKPVSEPAPAMPSPAETAAEPEAATAAAASPGADAVMEDMDGGMIPAGEEAPRRGRRLIRRLAKWIFVLALCAGLGYAISHAVRNPQAVVDAVSGLPEPIPSVARLVRDIIMTAPGREAPGTGEDPPRKGKSDRLPQDQAPAVR